MPKNRHLVTSEQASKILRVNRRTVGRLAASGKLPVALKIEGKTGAFLFDEADVLALAEQRQATAA